MQHVTKCSTKNGVIAVFNFVLKNIRRTITHHGHVSPICRLLKSIAFNTESGEDSVLPISSQECTGTTPGPPRRSAGAQGAASSSSSLSPSPPGLQSPASI